MITKIIVKERDYKEVGLQNFLDRLATEYLGISNVDDITYDIKKLQVAENIQTEWINYYLGKGYTGEELNQIMLVFFPRVELSLGNNEIVYEDGFIIENKQAA